MTTPNSIKTNPLLGFSYSLQRYENGHQSSIISLLVSAASTDLPHRSVDHKDFWGVVIAGDITEDTTRILEEALTLASVDNVNRILFTSHGDTLYTEEQPKIDPISVDNTLPLLAQIVDLKHFSLDQLQETKDKREKDTSTQILLNDKSQRETKPFDSDLLSSTLELDDVSYLAQKSQPKINATGHLLILCNQAFESITPSILPKDLSSFKSITVFYTGDDDNVLSWLRWSAQLGAYLVLKDDQIVQKLADRFQSVSRKLGRQAIHFTAGSGFSIISVTQLTPIPGPIPVDTSERNAQEITLWSNQPSADQRWSAMITFKRVNPTTSQPTLSFVDSGQKLSTIHINEHSCPIMIPHAPLSSSDQRRAEAKAVTNAINNPLNGMLLPRSDSNLLGVAFAQQLCHRVRVIDNLVLSLLRRESRKSARLLDQLLKITSTLESGEKVELIRLLKVQILATGQLKASSKKYIVNLMIQSPHILSIDGVWRARI